MAPNDRKSGNVSSVRVTGPKAQMVSTPDQVIWNDLKSYGGLFGLTGMAGSADGHYLVPGGTKCSQKRYRKLSTSHGAVKADGLYSGSSDLE